MIFNYLCPKQSSGLFILFVHVKLNITQPAQRQSAQIEKQKSWTLRGLILPYFKTNHFYS